MLAKILEYLKEKYYNVKVLDKYLLKQIIMMFLMGVFVFTTIIFASDTFITLINPSIKDIIPLVQVGDILCYTGHTFLIYDIEKDNDGKVIDAIIMESGHGKGIAYVNSKIGKERIKL